MIRKFHNAGVIFIFSYIWLHYFFINNHWSRRKANLLLYLFLPFLEPALNIMGEISANAWSRDAHVIMSWSCLTACDVTRSELDPCCSLLIIISNLHCHVKGYTTSLCFYLNLNHWQTLWVVDHTKSCIQAKHFRLKMKGNRSKNELFIINGISHVISDEMPVNTTSSMTNKICLFDEMSGIQYLKSWSGSRVLKQNKYCFSINVILKRVHSCFQPVKQKDTDTFNYWSVCCTECWYTVPVGK